MYLAGSYPKSIQYAPYPPPPYRDPYGVIAQPELPPDFRPPPGYECKPIKEDSSKSCWCAVIIIATVLTVLNLVHLILEIVGMIDVKHPFLPWGRAYDKAEDYVPDEDMYLYYDCTYAPDLERWPHVSYITIRILFASCVFGYFVATIGFMAAAVFNDPAPEEQLRWCKVFLWTSFCYPALSRLLLIVDMLIIHGECSKSTILRDRFNNATFWVFVLSLVNGFLAIVMMIMVQRQSMVSPQVSQHSFGGGRATGPSPAETDEN